LIWTGKWLISWNQWWTYHNYVSILLFIAGAMFGYTQGKYWWNRIYVKKDLPWKKWKK